MISASALNSELINKIAQDFAQATSLAVVVVNIHGDEISELFNFTPFCQLMRQHPQHSTRCRMSDRCGGLEAQGGGFVAEIAALAEAGIPLLTIVAPAHLPAWRALTGELGQELPMPQSVQTLHDWFYSLQAPGDTA